MTEQEVSRLIFLAFSIGGLCGFGVNALLDKIYHYVKYRQGKMIQFDMTDEQRDRIEILLGRIADEIAKDKSHD